MAIFSPCPACAGTCSPVFEATDENRRVSARAFHYVQCTACRLIFLPEFPADLHDYYRGEYYAIPDAPTLKALARKDTNKIDTIRRFVQSGRLLEVGPAFGVFAWQAKDAGFAVGAIEMDPRCCDYLNDTLDIPTVRSDQPHAAIKDMPPHDVIAIWHVIEHLPEPFLFLESAAANLAPGGILVIATPNPQAFQFRLMGRHWPHVDAPRHLTLIPSDLLVRMAGAAGLETVLLTSDDSDARSWNRFGWQRLLMNRVRTRPLQAAAYALGWLISLVFAPWDRHNGSAYTLVLKKKVGE